MALYSYKAMTRDGMTRTGSLEATNEADLEKRLGNMKLDLIKADLTVQKPLTPGNHRVERRDLIIFCLQMSQLLRAGVPLIEALSDLRDSLDSPQFKEVIASLIEVIESGKNLSQSMEDFPQVFDTLFISLIRAGEATGRLAEVLEALTDMIKWQDELATSTKKLLMTPLIVGTVVLGVTGFLMVYLVPQLIQFIEGIGQELPLHTRALIATSSFIRNFWYLWLFIPPALFIGAQILIRTNDDVRYRFDGLKLRIPKLGPVMLKIILSRFANFFSMMYAAGIPILASLEIAEGIIDNRVVRAAIAKARTDIEQGEPITQSLANTGMFPPLVLRMLKIGETTGKLDKALMNVSYFYERDIKDSIDKLQTLIQPAMTLVVGGMLGWVMISVLGPVYDSLSTVQ
ncbi:MAG: type II secretion system F family protein [Pseudomonadota bacterium]|nr:type II secretion system F family protein [Pseudomonadota bacterium]